MPINLPNVFDFVADRVPSEYNVKLRDDLKAKYSEYDFESASLNDLLSLCAALYAAWAIALTEENASERLVLSTSQDQEILHSYLVVLTGTLVQIVQANQALDSLTALAESADNGDYGDAPVEVLNLLGGFAVEQQRRDVAETLRKLTLDPSFEYDE